MAKSKTKTSSTPESSPEDILMVGKRQIRAHNVTSIHIVELDHLDEEYLLEEGKNTTAMTDLITETLRTLKPLYPPALSRQHLRKAFSVRDWKAPTPETLEAWTKEARNSVKRARPEDVTEDERRVLGAFLFTMMTDPKNDYIHAENTMWRLWEVSWGPDAVCALSDKTTLVGDSARRLLEKFRTLVGGGTPEMTELEVDASTTLLEELNGKDDSNISLPNSYAKKPLAWKLNFLTALGRPELEKLIAKLETSVT